MARIATWICGNCYTEEDAPDTDVNEITGEYLCTECRAEGKDSSEARRRRWMNGDGLGFGRVRFISKEEWEFQESLRAQLAKKRK